MEKYQLCDEIAVAPQQAFQSILETLNKPGVICTLNGVDSPDLDCNESIQTLSWGRMNAATTKVLLTLSNSETAVWLCDSFATSDIIENLHLHSESGIETDPNNADFIVIDSLSNEFVLSQLDVSKNSSRKKNVTVIVQVEHLSGGAHLFLSGPGIQNHIQISPVLPSALLSWFHTTWRDVECGLDFIFTHHDQILSIPRTTRVEVF